MARSQKTEDVTMIQSPDVVVPEEFVLVTFSQAKSEGRFGADKNQAKVLVTQLQKGEKFVEINGKNYIEANFSTHTELL